MTLFTGKLQEIEDVSSVVPPDEYVKIWVYAHQTISKPFEVKLLMDHK